MTEPETESELFPDTHPGPLKQGRLKYTFISKKKKYEVANCNADNVQNYVTSFVELLKEMKNSGKSLPKTFSVTKYFKDGKQAGAAHGLLLELLSEIKTNQKISVIEFGSSAIKINPVYKKTEEDKMEIEEIDNNEVVDICKIGDDIDLENLKTQFKTNIAKQEFKDRPYSDDTKFVIFLSGGHIKKHKDSKTATEFVKSCNIPSLLKDDIYTQEGVYEARSALHNMKLDDMLSDSTTRLIVTSIGGKTCQTTVFVKNKDGNDWNISGDILEITMKKKGPLEPSDRENLEQIFSPPNPEETQVMFMSTWGFVIRNAYNQYPDKTNKTVKKEVYVTGGPCEEGQKPEWKYETLDNWDIFFDLLPRDSFMKGVGSELEQNPPGGGGGKKTRHKNRKNKKRKTKRIRMKMKNSKTKIRKKTSKKYKRKTKKRA